MQKFIGLFFTTNSRSGRRDHTSLCEAPGHRPFLAFRSVCRKYHDLLNAHMTGVTEFVATSTFPGQTCTLRYERPGTPSTADEHLRWLKNLKLYELASIVGEHWEEKWDGECRVAAANPLAEKVPAQDIKEWKIICELSKIEQDIEALSFDEPPLPFLPISNHLFLDQLPSVQRLAMEDSEKAGVGSERYCVRLGRLVQVVFGS